MRSVVHDPAGLSQYSPTELVEKWEEFFDAYDYGGRIRALADAWPERRALEVPFDDLDRFDADFAIYMLARPQTSLVAAEEAITRIAPPGDEPIRVHVRMQGLPEDVRPKVRDLRPEHLGRLLALAGLVRKATPVFPRIVDATFQCLRCPQVIKEPQEGTQFREPMECYADQGGCGRTAASTKFKLIGEASQYLAMQKVEIQEPLETLRGGEAPQRLEAWLEDDIAGSTRPGERLILNGILRSTQRGHAGARTTRFDMFLDVSSIEKERMEYEEVDVSLEDEARIRAEASIPGVLDRIVLSIAPAIYGMETEKEALALQLFGGVPKTLPDGTRIRGDSHILLIGDPSTAKSQLLVYMAQLASRAVQASGRGASGPGLTAAAVKDDFGEGRWALEAGVLPLADKGMAIVDELEKMNPEDRGSIHQAMEQQEVHIAKAGITATLPARCSVLAAANPKFGRFDTNKIIGEQLELEPALLSRFDCIFPILDVPHKVRDAATASHILDAHQLGEIRAGGVSSVPDNGSSDAYTPYFDAEFLRKYVALAKRVAPVMTDEAKLLLHVHYVTERNNGGGRGSSVPLSARQLEAYVRLAEASARARLSPIVETADAERAIRITAYWLSRIATDGIGGPIDIDIIATGIPASQREQIVRLRDIIAELGGTAGGEGANHMDVLELAEHRGIPRDRAEAWLRKWKTEGDLYSPVEGRYKLVDKL